MKKFLVAAALAAAALTPLGAEAQMKDSLIIGMALEPAPGLDPTVAAAAAISQVTAYNVYENLVRIDESGTVSGMLASDWSISEDGMTYRFNLLSGVKFHDGTTFDASDIRFVFERNAAEDSSNKEKRIFRGVAAVETPDDHTVLVSLKQPNGIFLFKMALSASVIVGPESAATNGTNPIGTGPYRFSEWIQGDSVSLVANPDHRNAANIQIKSVKFRFISDPTAQVTALLSGDIDALPRLSAPEMFPQFQNNPDFVALQGTSEGETILSMNNKDEVLSDVRVRRAIMHAIDRQALIDGAMSGYGTPIGTHFAPHNPAYLDLTGVYAFDQAKARALLLEAGYDNDLELTLHLPPPSYARRGGEIIAAMLSEVGVTAKIENVEWASWLENVYRAKNYDLTIVSHVEPMDIGRIYSDPGYYIQYDSQEFRDIFKKFEVAGTVEEQTKYLQQAQRKVTEDAAVGYLFQLAKLGVVKKGLTGVWSNSPAFINDVAAMRWQ
jgi:peptide/nickel transport system substrate-binding protein